MCVFKNTAAGTQVIMAESAAGAITIGLYSVGTNLRFTADAGATDADGTIVADTWYIATGIHDNAATPKTLLRINGVEQGNTAAANRTADTETLYLGALNSAAQPLDGEIAEAAVFRHTATQMYEGDIEGLEEGLARIYGITLG